MLCKWALRLKALLHSQTVIANPLLKVTVSVFPLAPLAGQKINSFLFVFETLKKPTRHSPAFSTERIVPNFANVTNPKESRKFKSLEKLDTAIFPR